MSNDRAIVCVGVRSWYPKGVTRLHKSILEHDSDTALVEWSAPGDWPPGSPPHHEAPYAFKVYALREAERRGFRYALWLDSSCWLIGSIDPVWEHIAREGYAFWLGGQSVGLWCGDMPLAELELDRETALTLPLNVGGIMGFDFEHPGAREFLQRFQRYAERRIAFMGDWTNDAGQVSSDPRVRGHRHDQCVSATIIHRMGLSMIHCPLWFSYWKENMDDRIRIVAQGM